jgi:hypothetical protein
VEARCLCLSARPAKLERARAREIEQEGGVEPADSGVAHRCVTATLHLLGRSLRRDLVFWTIVDAGARSMALAWVEWESNPRLSGLRIRCKASVCYRPARRFVPPSGIEPEPLGFQPSAQTTCARVGSDAACELVTTRTRRSCFLFLGCLPRHPSSSLFGCQRAPAVRWAHLGPRCIRKPRERTIRVLVISSRDR